MASDLAVLIAKVAELHGRTREISSRLREDIRLLVGVQEELSLTLRGLWELRADAKRSATPLAGPRMLRLPEVLKRVGLARSLVWRMVKEERFPPRWRLS